MEDSPLSPENPRVGRGTLVWSGRNVGKVEELKSSATRKYARVLVLVGVDAGRVVTWLQWREASEADLTRIRKWYEDQAFKLSIPMRMELMSGAVLKIESP